MQTHTIHIVSGFLHQEYRFVKSLQLKVVEIPSIGGLKLESQSHLLNMCTRALHFSLIQTTSHFCLLSSRDPKSFSPEERDRGLIEIQRILFDLGQVPTY